MPRSGCLQVAHGVGLGGTQGRYDVEVSMRADGGRLARSLCEFLWTSISWFVEFSKEAGSGRC